MKKQVTKALIKKLEVLPGIPALVVKNLIKELAPHCNKCMKRGLAPCVMDQLQCTYTQQLISVTQQLKSDK